MRTHTVELKRVCTNGGISWPLVPTRQHEALIAMQVQVDRYWASVAYSTVQQRCTVSIVL